MIRALSRTGLNFSFSNESRPAAIAVIRGVEKLVPTCSTIPPFSEKDLTGNISTPFLAFIDAAPPICTTSGFINCDGPGPNLENEDGFFKGLGLGTQKIVQQGLLGVNVGENSFEKRETDEITVIQHFFLSDMDIDRDTWRKTYKKDLHNNWKLINCKGDCD